MFYHVMGWLLSSQVGQILGKPGDYGVPKTELDSGRLSSVLNIVYFIATAVAVVVIIIAGILFSTSAGDASKVSRARNAIIYSVVGLVVVVMAYGITAYIAEKF